MMNTKALDLVPVGYVILDEYGHIDDVNGIAAAVLASDEDELRGRRFADLVSPSDTWRLLKHLRQASRSGERETCRIELKSGADSSRLAHLFTQVEHSVSGTVERFHTALLTVPAELIRAKEEAEQMSRLKTAFLANMSHEIRTPLTGIIGFASVLSKELPEEHREFADLIRSSGRRLLEMLNSVLDLAKLESNEMSLEQREIDLAIEVRRVVDLLAPIADEKGLLIEVETNGDRPHVIRSDRAALNRILHNLIGNAIKFTDHGYVRVTVWEEGDQVGFDVTDTGIGIEPNFIPQLFDEFSQESSGMNRSHSGTGLGLAITKRLVDLMGGEIHVESTKNTGSRFRVALPRNRDAAVEGRLPQERRREEAAASGQETRPGKENLRLLLVEDHVDTQHLLKELLEEQYDVAVVGTASEAFLFASQYSFDVILMDINLGDGPDGVELLKQLRATAEYADTPIVALTAYALPGDKERFLDLGFSAYVSKPFDVDELLQLPMELG